MKVSDIAIVLDAVSEIEMWDDKHPSVASARDGAWKFHPSGHPQPSRKLLELIRELERGDRSFIAERRL